MQNWKLDGASRAQFRADDGLTLPYRLGKVCRPSVRFAVNERIALLSTVELRSPRFADIRRSQRVLNRLLGKVKQDLLLSGLAIG